MVKSMLIHFHHLTILPFHHLLLVGRGGFEPPKAAPTDLQSAPFDRSGISPIIMHSKNLKKPADIPQVRADGRIRTADQLITNQLLYQLSYIGMSSLLKGLQK